MLALLQAQQEKGPKKEKDVAPAFKELTVRAAPELRGGGCHCPRLLTEGLSEPQHPTRQGESHSCGICGDIAGNRKQAGDVLWLDGPRSRGVTGLVCRGLERKEEAPRPCGFCILRSGASGWKAPH